MEEAPNFPPVETNEQPQHRARDVPGDAEAGLLVPVPFSGPDRKERGRRTREVQINRYPR